MNLSMTLPHSGIYGQGLYPTPVRIIDCIPEGLSCEWMTFSMAVYDAQEALGASQ
jgi:hypothetical protein